VRTPDGQTIQVRGVFVAEWERQGDGRWLIRRMHTAPPGKDG
jgi:ketosteroid isomerase-like protein